MGAVIARKGSDGKPSLSFLDIGSNAGDIAFSLAEHLASQAPEATVRALGVEIDKVLVERSVEAAKAKQGARRQFEFEQCNVMDDAVFESLKKRAPAGTLLLSPLN
jgi:hypothetical protein